MCYQFLSSTKKGIQEESDFKIKLYRELLITEFKGIVWSV
jgi:hypothetical protein